MKYKPHIDGLRALAVIVVLFFHAGIPYFGGGFVGVDVFFVISGFLITSIIESETSTGSFSLTSFYERRARRILPALFMVISACLAVGALTAPPDDLKNLSLSALSATLFGSNLFFWLEPAGYFADAHLTKPLLHTWSLAVEEQFYIFFPLLLVAAGNVRSISKSALIVALLTSSLLLSILGAYAKPSATFFFLPTRMWELMIGALLAVELPRIKWANARIPSNSLTLIGIGLILFPVLVYDNSMVFPGAAALAPCLGAAVLIVCGYDGRLGKPRIIRALEWQPIVQIGLISYPLYLWHWPFLSFAFRLQYSQPGTLKVAIALAGSFASAWLTWRLIESPVRGRMILTYRSSVFWAALSGGAVIILASVTGWITEGFPQRIPSELREAAAKNKNLHLEWAYPCSNYKRNITSANPIQLCTIGSGTKDGILFWGDSHVEQIYSQVKQLVEDFGQSNSKKVIFMTSGSCLPLLGLERNARDFACEKFNNAAMALALQPAITRVIISGFWTDFFPDQNFSSRSYNFVRILSERRVAFHDENDILAFFSDSLTREVQALRAAGKEVVLVMPYPTYKYSIPEYMWQRIFYRLKPEVLLTWQAYMAEKGRFRSVIESVAQLTGAGIADPAALLCKSECQYQEAFVSLYMDSHHLLPRGVQHLSKMLHELIERSGQYSVEAATTGFIMTK